MVSGCGPGFQPQPLLGVDRRQLVERLDVEVVVGRHAVDVENLAQPRALLLAVVLHHAADQHAFAEAELLDHRAGHEGIGPLAVEVGRRVAEEAVAVGVHFQHARAGGQRQQVAVVLRLVLAAALVLAVGAPALLAAAAAAAAMPPPPPPPMRLLFCCCDR